MSKVWIVTDGCYSDYHMIRAFSTKELADQWVAERDYEVEELSLDDSSGIDKNCLSETRVKMLRDGTVMEIREIFPEDHHEIFGRRFYYHVSSWGVPPYFSIDVPTLDEKEAIKTANEIRHRMIALERVEPGWYKYDTLERYQ